MSEFIRPSPSIMISDCSPTSIVLSAQFEEQPPDKTIATAGRAGWNYTQSVQAAEGDVVYVIFFTASRSEGKAFGFPAVLYCLGAVPRIGSRAVLPCAVVAFDGEVFNKIRNSGLLGLSFLFLLENFIIFSPYIFLFDVCAPRGRHSIHFIF